jgi:hypothetical protein
VRLRPLLRHPGRGREYQGTIGRWAEFTGSSLAALSPPFLKCSFMPSFLDTTSLAKPGQAV